MTDAVNEPGAPLEELRFAVVLNGGVSLAVWIGGATLEIDRMTRREGLYARLLDLVRSEARVDVITGTSAGGINGAALALAQVNQNADLRALRTLWATEGKMETLLRTPFVGAPSSLLKGDEYFLPTLKRALEGLAQDYDPRSAEQRPIHLGITTTLLRGGRTLTSDSLGQDLPQAMHAGVLTFRHLEPDEQGTVDDFAKDQIHDTVRRLAMAARSSAGFPVAFEPAFLPVGEPFDPTPARDEATDAQRVDLRHNANWADPDGSDAESRFAVDGGVLVNTPTVSALNAIDSLPTRHAVRRVMLLVFPHAPEDSFVPADRREDAPTLTDTMAGILGAMRAEAGRTHVEKVDEHNRRAADRRGGRSDVLVTLIEQSRPEEDDGPTFLTLLDGLATRLFPYYRDLRMRRSSRDLADRAPVVRGWSYERTLRAIEVAQRDMDRSRSATPRLPYMPDSSDWSFLHEPPTGVPKVWPWGVTTAEHLIDDALDLLRRLDWKSATSAEAGPLETARETAYRVKARVLQQRATLERVWNSPEFRDQEPTADYWKLWLATHRQFYLSIPASIPPSHPVFTHPLDAPGGHAAEERAEMTAQVEVGRGGQVVVDELAKLAKALIELKPMVRAAAHDLAKASSNALDDEAEILKAWSELLSGDEICADDLITRMLRVDVVTSCLSNVPDRGSEQFVELAQISLHTPNAFATTTTAGADKLGGNRLGRFAGFLKESWRINDWTWGRLDATTMLCRIVLEPRRVRRSALRIPSQSPTEQAKETVDELVRDFFGTTAQLPPHFDSLRKDAESELARYVFAKNEPHDFPPTLACLADLFAWAIQADIATEEMPALQVAITADQNEGATKSSLGARFLQEQEVLLSKLRKLPSPGRTPEPATSRSTSAQRRIRRRVLGLEALVAFDRAGVGREPLDQEASGDLMIRTGVTAAAVGVTLLDSPALGVPAARPITRTIRGFALVPYWLARGLTGGSRMAQALAVAALAIGAATLGVSLLVSSTPRWVALLGASVVLFSISYAALRTRSLVHGLVLVAPVVPLIVYSLAVRADSTDNSGVTPLLLFITALVVGALVLGSLPGLPGTPLAVFTDHKFRVTLAGFTIVVIGFAVYAEWEWAWIEDSVDGCVDGAGWCWQAALNLGLAAAVVGVLLGVGLLVLLGLVAHSGSRTLRVQIYASPEEGTGGLWKEQRVAHPDAVAATWSYVYAVLALAASIIIGLATSSAYGTQDLPPAAKAMWSAVVTAGLMFIGLLTASVWLPLRARRRFESDLIRVAVGGAFRVGKTDAAAKAALRSRLIARGTAYAYLLKPDKSDESKLELTKAGRSLAARLKREVDKVGGA